jgi:hypothetical protein
LKPPGLFVLLPLLGADNQPAEHCFSQTIFMHKPTVRKKKITRPKRTAKQQDAARKAKAKELALAFWMMQM